MKHLTAAEARAFAERWLPAWSGNDPERLAISVQLDAGGKIRRNEVYFDRSELLQRIARARAAK